MDEKDEIILNLSRALAPQQLIGLAPKSNWEPERLRVLGLISHHAGRMGMVTRGKEFLDIMDDLYRSVEVLK